MKTFSNRWFWPFYSNPGPRLCQHSPITCSELWPAYSNHWFWPAFSNLWLWPAYSISGSEQPTPISGSDQPTPISGSFQPTPITGSDQPTVGAKSLERLGKITHERPKKDFSLKFHYLFKNIALPLVTSVNKRQKSYKHFSVLSVEKSYSFFVKLYKCQSYFF